MIGKTILHYKILEKLGEGGMGVVYKAEDTKLKRMVALKFLPSHALGSEEDRARFVREAQAAAALNHPNIATIYEINEYEGDIFIAMEYIDGQTLKKKIDEGPLKIKEAISIAKQVASGLQAAHEKGIFHRDIKSANVMVTDKGQAKILDFGLAKMVFGSMLTKAGRVLGTIAYMSPEQARGEEVDYRTDIWSLGVLLYEMVSGRLPFKGEYESSMIYSILNVEPEPLTALRTGVPIALDGIVTKLLAKDPDSRYQHVDELPVDLKAVEVKPSGTQRDLATTTVAAETQWSAKWLWGLSLILIGLIIGALAAGVAVRFLMQTTPSKQQTYDITLPPNTELSLIGGEHSVALSPDGMHLVYTATSNDVKQLYLRMIGEEEEPKTRPIPGTEGAKNPFFSPDGQWVGFFTENELKKVHVDGVEPITLCKVHITARGGSWGDNTIIFAPHFNRGLFSISADEETQEHYQTVAEQVTTPNRGEGGEGHFWPQILEGGKVVLYIVYASGSAQNDLYAHVALEVLDTHERVPLRLEGSRYARYVSGHLVYLQGSSLFAVTFDLSRLEVTGEPERVIKEILVKDYDGIAHFTVSDDGTLVYVPEVAEPEPQYTLVWKYRDGKEETLEPPFKDQIIRPRLSPDGSRIALEVNEDVAILDIADVNIQILTPEPELEGFPIWHPKGRRVVYNHLLGGLFEKEKPGYGNSIELIDIEGKILFPNSWLSDGSVMVFKSISIHESQSDIWLWFEDGREAKHWFTSLDNESDARFSPDGNWIAYTSDSTGIDEVYVRPYINPEENEPIKISSGGGTEPVWSLVGNELFYRSDKTIMVVEYQTEPKFKPGEPEEMFDWDFYNVKSGSYDVSPEGKFLMVKCVQDLVHTELKVVLNLFDR